LKVLEEVGRAVSSSLDLNAVLPTVAARALEITRADAVLIYSYDAAERCFRLVEAKGVDRTQDGVHNVLDEETTLLAESVRSGEPIAIAELASAPLPSSGPLSPVDGLKEQVKAAMSRLERELIVRALKQTNNNVTHAARMLKISRKSLQIKMKELGLREENG
jgi:transcriptional regulator with GAF, ATPase, and Fis domain